MKSTNFVEGNDEWSRTGFQQIERFDGLWLETVLQSAIRQRRPTTMQTDHDIHNQNGNVTQRTASCAQVGKGLVPRSVDDEKTRNLELEQPILVHDGRFGSNGFNWEVGRTNLLGNTSCFSFLYVCLTDLQRCQS